nr:PREDICTED: uncharacterized protein C1orf177 homolog [Apteryx mantelli mantelli]
MKRHKHVKETLGPGTYGIKDFLQEKRPSSLRGVCDARERRFRDVLRVCPGFRPGSHESCRQAQPWGWERNCPSNIVRLRPWGCKKETLGPGTYGIKDFLQEKRPSSLRGVCDARERRFRDVLRVCPGFRPGSHESCRQAQPWGWERNCPSNIVRLRPWGCKARLGRFWAAFTGWDSKKKGRFRTVPREPGRPAERISWATLSQRPRDVLAAGPGSYDPKPIERSEYFNQPPFWSSAKRFDRKSCCLFAGNEVSEKTRLPGPVKPSCLCPHLPHPYCLCDDGEPHVTFSFQNPVGVGRYNITKHEKYPRKIRYQSLYQCETRRYLSDLERDAYLLERLKPSAKNNWNDLIAAPHCPDTSEEITVVF